MSESQMDPYKTMLVCKHDGREVVRIAATAHNAREYVNGLQQHYKTLTVDYVYDENAGLIASLRGPVRRHRWQ